MLMNKKIKTGLYSLQENYNIFEDGNMQKLFLNSSRVTHPKLSQQLSSLLKLYTPLGHERCLPHDRHLGTDQHSGNSRNYWRKVSLNRIVFFTTSTSQALRWLTCPGWPRQTPCDLNFIIFSIFEQSIPVSSSALELEDVTAFFIFAS